MSNPGTSLKWYLPILPCSLLRPLRGTLAMHVLADLHVVTAHSRVSLLSPLLELPGPNPHPLWIYGSLSLHLFFPVSDLNSQPLVRLHASLSAFIQAFPTSPLGVETTRSQPTCPRSDLRILLRGSW